ncbi:MULTISPECIES: ubiquitin-like domain-containing protein [unclassified Solibacillus]|uniref:ubiquitin-like domain-containing protein n=1 Tax=unclassified Solibacillus TaxID=2637870 RepID=UPI0030FA7EAA
MSNQSMKSQFLGSLRSKQTGIRVLSVVLFVSVIAFVLYHGTKTPVTLIANGETSKLYTHATTVDELLTAQNIDLTNYDKVSPSLSTKIDSGMSIEWEQAKEIVISVDGNQSKVWTTEKVVKNILEEANIEVTEQDLVSQSLDTEVGADNKIDIQKAFQLTLVDGTKERQVWSTSTTVANFLKQQEIQLGESDRVDKNLEDVITPNDKIAVVRVEKVTDVVEESVDFPIERKNDSSLLKGKEKVVTEGKKGKVERTYNIVKENGKVVSKKVASEKIIDQPKTKVLSVGTKVVTAKVSRSSEPKSGKEFYVEATAYTPHCTGCSGISAAGLNLRANPDMKVIAVDPRIIPLGTKVWVEGYGNAVAADTGGAIKGNKIDVLVPTKSEAYNWGRKKVRLKVLK